MNSVDVNKVQQRNTPTLADQARIGGAKLGLWRELTDVVRECRSLEREAANALVETAHYTTVVQPLGVADAKQLRRDTSKRLDEILKLQDREDGIIAKLDELEREQ